MLAAQLHGYISGHSMPYRLPIINAGAPPIGQPTSPTVAPHADDPDHRVYVDVVRLYLAHWRTMLVAIALVNVAVMVAWRDHAPLYARAAWCGAALLDYLGQAVVCTRIERSAFPAQAIAQWMPWLLVTIAVSSVLWALVPWLIPGASTQGLLFACLFNAGLVFCVANSPRTPTMLLCGTLPIAVLDTLLLMNREGLFYMGLGFPVLIALIILYGLRSQSVLGAGIVARHRAENLARDLYVNQRRLVEVERERTLLLERERLTRDMHDGLGSVLVGSLVEAERGEIDAERLTAILRECVDDLRSVIDSLEPVDHDLIALLSTLRYRLERRFDAAGLVSEWDMQDVPPLVWMGPPEALHVMRFVQEVLNNVIKHAASRRICVAAKVRGGEVEISIVDDGKGFDTTATLSGRGIRSLRQRAAALGGSVQIGSECNFGTCVILRLPIEKGGAKT